MFSSGSSSDADSGSGSGDGSGSDSGYREGDGGRERDDVDDRRLSWSVATDEGGESESWSVEDPEEQEEKVEEEESLLFPSSFVGDVLG